MVRHDRGRGSSPAASLLDAQGPAEPLPEESAFCWSCRQRICYHPPPPRPQNGFRQRHSRCERCAVVRQFRQRAVKRSRVWRNGRRVTFGTCWARARESSILSTRTLALVHKPGPSLYSAYVPSVPRGRLNPSRAEAAGEVPRPFFHALYLELFTIDALSGHPWSSLAANVLHALRTILESISGASQTSYAARPRTSPHPGPVGRDRPGPRRLQVGARHRQERLGQRRQELRGQGATAHRRGRAGQSGREIRREHGPRRSGQAASARLARTAFLCLCTLAEHTLRMASDDSSMGAPGAGRREVLGSVLPEVRP